MPSIESRINALVDLLQPKEADEPKELPSNEVLTSKIYHALSIEAHRPTKRLSEQAHKILKTLYPACSDDPAVAWRELRDAFDEQSRRYWEEERPKMFAKQHGSPDTGPARASQFLRPTSVPVVPMSREAYLTSSDFERQRAANMGKNDTPLQERAITMPGIASRDQRS